MHRPISISPENIHISSWKINITLAVDEPAIPSEVSESAQKYGLSKKWEFHITVIGSEVQKKLYAVLKPHTDKKALETAIKETARQVEWSMTFLDEYYIIEKTYLRPEQTPQTETRRTLIQMVDMESMGAFYAYLNALLSLGLETPPPHITLFSASTDPEKQLRGIWITTQKDLKQFTIIRV